MSIPRPRSGFGSGPERGDDHRHKKVPPTRRNKRRRKSPSQRSEEFYKGQRERINEDRRNAQDELDARRRDEEIRRKRNPKHEGGQNRGQDRDYPGNGEGPTGNEGCNGCPPVVLDLNRDGEFALIGDDKGGWVGPGDGLLAVDRDGSGVIDSLSEVAFVEEDARARTDLEGLAYGFDSNGDGVVNNQDGRFDELKVFQDTNGNRRSDAGELKTLTEAGITSIDVSNVPYQGEPEVIAEKNGNRIFGTTTASFEDSSEIAAADVYLGSRADVIAAQLAEVSARMSGGHDSAGNMSLFGQQHRRRPELIAAA